MSKPMAYITFTIEPQDYAEVEALRKAEGRSLSMMVRILVLLGIQHRRAAETAPTKTE